MGSLTEWIQMYHEKQYDVFNINFNPIVPSVVFSIKLIKQLKNDYQ